MKTIEQMLNDACRNHYGFYDAVPGNDIYHRLAHLTESARKTMLKRGYLRKVGSGLVLTQAGYNA